MPEPAKKVLFTSPDTKHENPFLLTRTPQFRLSSDHLDPHSELKAASNTISPQFSARNLLPAAGDDHKVASLIEFLKGYEMLHPRNDENEANMLSFSDKKKELPK